MIKYMTCEFMGKEISYCQVKVVGRKGRLNISQRKAYPLAIRGVNGVA